MITMAISKTQADIRIRKNFKCNLKEFFVYVHKKESDGSVFYVGKGKGVRWCNVHSRSRHWKNTARKHGVYCDIVAASLTAQEALVLEKKLIEAYGRQDKGTGCLVNMTAGGDGVVDYVFTEEHRQKMSEAGMGKRHTEESKEKIRQANLNRKFSPETIIKMSEVRKGIPYTDAQRKALATRANPRARKVICIETGAIYESITGAAKDLNLDSSNLTKVCNGKRKSYKGFTWKYVENLDNPI